MADSITADAARMELLDEESDEDEDEDKVASMELLDEESDEDEDDDDEDGFTGEKPNNKKTKGPTRKHKPKKPLPPDVIPVEPGFILHKFMDEAFRIASNGERMPDYTENGELKEQGLYIQEERFNKHQAPKYRKGMTMDEEQEAYDVYRKFWDEEVDPRIKEAYNDYKFVNLRFRKALIALETLEERNKLRASLELNDVGDPTGCFTFREIRNLKVWVAKSPKVVAKRMEKNEAQKAKYFLEHLNKTPAHKKEEFAARHGRDMTTGYKCDFDRLASTAPRPPPAHPPPAPLIESTQFDLTVANEKLRVELEQSTVANEKLRVELEKLKLENQMIGGGAARSDSDVNKVVAKAKPKLSKAERNLRNVRLWRMRNRMTAEQRTIFARKNNIDVNTAEPL